MLDGRRESSNFKSVGESDSRVNPPFWLRLLWGTSGPEKVIRERLREKLLLSESNSDAQAQLLEV